MSAHEETVVGFRVDGNADMGMGHVMRCLSLASQVRRKITPRIYFIMRDFDAAVERVIEDGYTALTLPRKLNRDEEVRRLREQVEKKGISVLMVDTLDADADLVGPLRAKGVKVGVIDDLGGKKFGANLLVNGSLVEEFTRYPPGAAGKILLGPQYMIVREDFLLQSLREKRISKEARSVLVTLGGADFHRTVYSVTEAIEEMEGDFKIVVVLGKAFVDVGGFEKYVKAKRHEYMVLHNVSSLAGIMYHADVAVVSGGMTLYELVCTRTPGVVICMDEKQAREAVEFEKRGAIVNAGLWREVTAAAIEGKLEQLMGDYKKRAQVYENCRDIMDGRGAARVIEELFGK